MCARCRCGAAPRSPSSGMPARAPATERRRDLALRVRRCRSRDAVGERGAGVLDRRAETSWRRRHRRWRRAHGSLRKKPLAPMPSKKARRRNRSRPGRAGRTAAKPGRRRPVHRRTWRRARAESARAETRTRLGAIAQLRSFGSSMTSSVSRTRPLAWCSIAATRPVSAVVTAPAIFVHRRQLGSSCARRRCRAAQASALRRRSTMPDGTVREEAAQRRAKRGRQQRQEARLRLSAMK